MSRPMTRATTGCLTLAFLTLIGKTLVTYAVFSVAREVHAVATGNEVVQHVGPLDDALKAHLYARWRGEAYLSGAAHMQVLMVAVATGAYAAAIGGWRWAAAFLAVLVLVGLPVDLPLGVVEIIQRSAGTATGLPAALTWSWLPRDPFAIMRWSAGPEPTGLPDWDTANALVMAVFVTPGFLAATVVLSAMSERPDPDGTPAPALPKPACPPRHPQAPPLAASILE